MVFNPRPDRLPSDVEKDQVNFYGLSHQGESKRIEGFRCVGRIGLFNK